MNFSSTDVLLLVFYTFYTAIPLYPSITSSICLSTS